MAGMARHLYLVLLLSLASAASAAEQVVIGVLSHRGDESTLSHWSPTADYLSAKLPTYHFVIHPLSFNEVEGSVARGEVDFVLVNPAIYVNLEVRYRVSRLATMRNRWQGDVANTFGGVIFARAERYDLNTLNDLRGGTLSAVNASSLGGYMVALREFKAAGIEPHRDLRKIIFSGTHDKVVMAVREGLVDAGTVRTDILEHMAAEGLINLNEFRIINRHSDAEFPRLHSTRLYPEWPFSKVRHTSNSLARQVSLALAEMDENNPAVLAGNYAGWAIPLDYQPVHDLLQELLLPPYQYSQQFTLLDVWQRYRLWLAGGFFLLLIMGGMTTWVLRLNQQLSAAKRQLEQQHALILDSVADGIYGVDSSGNSTFVNRAMEEITGWRREDLIGRNQSELLRHADDGIHPVGPGGEPPSDSLDDEQAYYVDDDLLQCRNGRTIPVEYCRTPILDSHGKANGAVVVFRDITARKKAAEEARQRQIEMAHVARLSTMGEMASGIAHELNQPLAAIVNYTRGSIRMLKSGREENNGELIDVMERVSSQAERAGEIIRQLRRFIRKEQPERKQVEINRLIVDLLNFLQPELRKAGVLLTLQLQEGVGKLWAHDIQLEQVLLNLIRNAIEAMHEVPEQQRRLTISTELVEEQIRVVVEDNGHGIDTAMQEEIFEPFVTTKQQGMGLGLSISRGIIESHGGELTLDNTVEKGTRMVVTLPLNGGSDGVGAG
jgi:PAS domain S-box-containing protein